MPFSFEKQVTNLESAIAGSVNESVQYGGGRKLVGTVVSGNKVASGKALYSRKKLQRHENRRRRNFCLRVFVFKYTYTHQKAVWVKSRFLEAYFDDTYYPSW